MVFKKWFAATAASILLATTVSTSVFANTEETRTIADESIYDVLVDRFFNGNGTNDFDVDAKDPAKFAGGDFSGLVAKRDFILNMGFTTLSIGPIFTTEKYDGSMPTSYIALEDNFGTEQELAQLIEQYQSKNTKVIADFPLNHVSANHEWATDAAKADWVQATADDHVQWNFDNPALRQALTEAVVTFATTHGFDGIRLTHLAGVDVSVIDELIAALKAAKADLYVISNEESTASFDVTFSAQTSDIYRAIFKNVDLDSARIEEHLTGADVPAQIMFDTLGTDRFILDVMESGGYPPTRMKMALASMLVLPGVPIIPYGSEIAMNGVAGEESHQLYNFKTDAELSNYLGQLQSLRNDSSTLRTGDFRLIENENGYIVFERKSEEEHWIVIINNSSETQRISMPVAEIGEGKEIRGMFENEIIRENKDGDYAIYLDREMVEVYQVIEERGFNISYFIALGLVLVLYSVFMLVLMKRGKVRRAKQDTERATKAH